MNDSADVNFEQYFTALQKRDGVLYCGGSDVESKFSDTEQDDLFGIEDTSWWFKYRARVIERIADKFLKKEECLFDIGGGNGYTTCYLQEAGYDTALLEPSPAACRNAGRRGLRTVICGTLSEDTVKDASIKQVTILDVLEHIEHDDEFLKTLWTKMDITPSGRGGIALLTVPAFQTLWSSEDDSAGHYRRYRLKALKELARAAGFEVLYINYFFEFLFLPILLVRVGLEKTGLLKRSEQRTAEEKKRVAKRQFQEKKGSVGHVLNLLENFEINRLIHNRKVRFGSSIICVLEKNPTAHESGRYL